MFSVGDRIWVVQKDAKALACFPPMCVVVKAVYGSRPSAFYGVAVITDEHPDGLDLPNLTVAASEDQAFKAHRDAVAYCLAECRLMLDSLASKETALRSTMLELERSGACE